MSVVSSEHAPRRSPSLRDSLELVLPSLPAELVGPEALPWLVSVASVLPPIHRAGFECRLDPNESTVDLQQGVFASDGEPGRIARFLAEAGPPNDAWAKVRDIAERWSTPGDQLHRIDEMWLELDAAPDDPASPLTLGDARPSVFAVLEGADAEALPIARELLRLLVTGGEAETLDAVLTRFSVACPPPARVSHIGVMLGRSVPAMRVHVTPVPPHEMDRYLHQIGCVWERDELEPLAKTLLDHSDWVVLCLDILGDQVFRVGLECFFATKQGLDPRWQPLLERLAALGLSSREKGQALLSWPGTITPLDAPGPWPDDLIVQSLVAPEDTFGYVDRRLSHIKLTFAPGQGVTAKAYFGFGHIWTRASATPAARPSTR